MGAVIEYKDPVEGFSGWLVYDGTDCRLAAGGCRVQSGLTVDALSMLATRMTLKERLLGINVDGAKCGMDYDPRAPGKEAALRRFLAFLRYEIMGRFSMGCDMGTRWEELEALAARERIPSIKYAIRSAQGLTDEDYFARLRMLDEPVGILTLAQRRAGHALAQAAVAAARASDLPAPLSCSLQGFGNLGRAAAYSLLEEGVRITAIADEFGCVADVRGLDVARMLASPHGAPVTTIAGEATRLPSGALFELPTDLLVLAGSENAMTIEQASSLVTPVVVVGANCGLAHGVETRLHESGVFVVPDFVGGIGGSASMEALFGPVNRPSPEVVLDSVTEIVQQIVAQVARVARTQGESPRTVATQLAANAPVRPDERPYGCCPYLSPAVTARVVGGVR
jgi:glutamate dehydrogenase/leucine dehydrogenase